MQTPSSDFSVYKVAASHEYAAIPNQSLRFIRQYLTEYQGFEHIPEAVHVKAILLPSAPKACSDFPHEGPVREISINLLRFYHEEAA